MKSNVVCTLFCMLNEVTGSCEQVLSLSVPAHTLRASLIIVALTMIWCVMKSWIVSKERMRSAVVCNLYNIMKCDQCDCLLQASMNVISPMCTSVHTFVKTMCHPISADARLE